MRGGLDALARSARRLWRIEEVAGGEILLRDEVTGADCRCALPEPISPSAVGQLWLARVLPSPAPGAPLALDPAPIALRHAAKYVVPEAVDAILADFPADRRSAVYPLVMKFGPEPDYWLHVIVDLLRGGDGTGRSARRRRR